MGGFHFARIRCPEWQPARISQTPPAAVSDSGTSAALPLPVLLDVLHEYDCGGLRRAPCIHALATEGFEKSGLAPVNLLQNVWAFCGRAASCVDPDPQNRERA